MKKPLKKIDYKQKYEEVNSLCDSLTELVQDLIDTETKVQKENEELRFQIESLKLEVKSREKSAERFYQAAVLIARQTNELKKENTTLKIRNNIIEHKEVRKNEARTQSGGCGA